MVAVRLIFARRSHYEPVNCLARTQHSKIKTSIWRQLCAVGDMISADCRIQRLLGNVAFVGE